MNGKIFIECEAALQNWDCKTIICKFLKIYVNISSNHNWKKIILPQRVILTMFSNRLGKIQGMNMLQNWPKINLRDFAFSEHFIDIFLNTFLVTK